MPQVSDFNLENQPARNLRLELNSILRALQTNNSGATFPTNPQNYQFYVDSDNNNLYVHLNGTWSLIGDISQPQFGASSETFTLNAQFPLDGEGTASDPLTIPNGAITNSKLASSTIGLTKLSTFVRDRLLPSFPSSPSNEILKFNTFGQLVWTQEDPASQSITLVNDLPTISSAENNLIYGENDGTSAANDIYFKQTHPTTSFVVRFDNIASRSSFVNSFVGGIGYSGREDPVPGRHAYGVGGSTTPTVPGLDTLARFYDETTQNYIWNLAANGGIINQTTLPNDIAITFQRVEGETISDETDQIPLTKLTNHNIWQSNGISQDNVNPLNVHDSGILRIYIGNSLVSIHSGSELSKIATTDDIQDEGQKDRAHSQRLTTDLKTAIQEGSIYDPIPTTGQYLVQTDTGIQGTDVSPETSGSNWVQLHSRNINLQEFGTLRSTGYTFPDSWGSSDPPVIGMSIEGERSGEIFFLNTRSIYNLTPALVNEASNNNNTVGIAFSQGNSTVDYHIALARTSDNRLLITQYAGEPNNPSPLKIWQLNSPTVTSQQTTPTRLETRELSSPNTMAMNPTSENIFDGSPGNWLSNFYAFTSIPVEDIHSISLGFRYGTDRRSQWNVTVDQSDLRNIGINSIINWPGDGQNTTSNRREFVNCLSLLGKHSSGTAKNQEIKPTRQQVHWSYTGTDGFAVLIFFRGTDTELNGLQIYAVGDNDIVMEKAIAHIYQ